MTHRNDNLPRACTAARRIAPLLVLVGCASSRPLFEATEPAATPIGEFANEGQDGGKSFGPRGGSDPATCDEARDTRSYVGCEYWPTITPNIVHVVFDFAVVVANTGDQEAEVTLTGPGSIDRKVTVAAGSLETIYLPWVDALKVDDSLGLSTFARGGAYHLVSSRPVIVYQFNPLEFKAEGGPSGKDWSTCENPPLATANGCFSYSNDASLLLPVTAMTGTYRVVAMSGMYTTGSYFVITGTADNTRVSVKLGPKSDATGSEPDGSNYGEVPGGAAGQTFSLSLDRGDVTVVRTKGGYDPSGTLISADEPIQVISGSACSNVPRSVLACDHLEESMAPAETLGQHYVVARPLGGRHQRVPDLQYGRLLPRWKAREPDPRPQPQAVRLYVERREEESLPRRFERLRQVHLLSILCRYR